MSERNPPPTPPANAPDGPSGAPLLPCVEVGAAPGTPCDLGVIWMHGLGADGHDFEPVVPELGLPRALRARFVFPHAPSIPVSLNMGMVMPAWYDLGGTDLSRIRHDEAGIRRSAAAIEALIARERARGLPSRRIVLAGFSQGGAMAMHVGLRHAEPLGGVVALSSFLVLAESIAAEAAAANRATPFFVGHGTRDPMVHESSGRRTRDLLSGMGWPVTYRTWPMEHSVCLEEIREVGAFLAESAGRAALAEQAG